MHTYTHTYLPKSIKLIQYDNKMYYLYIFFLFLMYFIDFAISVAPFPGFIPLHPSPPLPPAFTPLLSSCPWVIHISFLASLFPILFLTSPCLFCTYHLCFLFPVPFPSFSPLHVCANNLLCDLYFCESVPVLVVCLVHFLFICLFRFSC